MMKIIKYLNFFFIFFLCFSVNAKTLELPEVTAEYVCNTKFILGANVLETRTFRTQNKKRIDTVIQNVPQSVIIDYEKQTVSWVWSKTSSYLSVPLKKENLENLKKATNIIKLNKIKSDYIHGFEVDLYELEIELPDGTKEESTRWITKHGVTLKEVGFIDGSDGKLYFYSEFSNVKVFKQDETLFEVPNGYKVAPVEDLDDVNELLKTMVQRI